MTHEERLKRMIEICQAALDGETVQFDGRDMAVDSVDTAGLLDLSRVHRWRIKPQPISGWVNLYPDLYPAGRLHPTKEKADHEAGNDRTRCVYMVEAEPPEGEG